MRILGMNCFGHDSAVFLIDTATREVFAMSTERVTRIKHDAGDIAPILQAYNLAPVDHAAHAYATLDENYSTSLGIELRLQRAYRRIFARMGGSVRRKSRSQKVRSLLRAALAQPLDVARFVALRVAAHGPFAGTRRKGDLRQHLLSVIRPLGVPDAALSLRDHHLCHAASAYYCSPAGDGRRAVVLTLDSHGDGYFSTVSLFQSLAWERLGASKVETATIGAVYSIFTEALDLMPNSEEGKVEALAAYGAPNNALFAALRGCVEVSATGFRFDAVRAAPFESVDRVRAERARIGDEALAATVQRWLQDIVVEHLNLLHAKLGDSSLDTLCLAGGVCANVIMTLEIFERTPFRHIHVFPAMGDDGAAAGAAVLAALEAGEDVSWLRNLEMPYFGNAVSPAEAESVIRQHPGVEAEPWGDWPVSAARAVADGKIVALVQGRMEFGPRALGHRSILANPTMPDVRDRLNETIKRRPWYQPLCPSVLEEERDRLFEDSLPHKHMAIAFRLRREFRASLPSAIHVDGTARAQFVEERDDPAYYRLLTEMRARTGFGVVINTSFNLHGRTMVRTASDAIDDFLACNIDALYLEGFVVTRKERGR